VHTPDQHRGGPSDLPTEYGEASERRWVDLSHVITDGMTTYPGLPVPRYAVHLSRHDSRAVYAAGTEFEIDRITMVGNTGTYLDSAFHRYPDGPDLSELTLQQLADLPTVVIRTAGGGTRAVGVEALAVHDVASRAVLLNTGGDEHWGTPAYGDPGPHLTAAGASWLVEHGAVLVGIDALNIDDTSPAAAGARPAHSILLAAGIPVVEHLTGLGELPRTGARFTAVPPLLSGFGTFPVRAYASVPATRTA
jgi:arylformamidase